MIPFTCPCCEVDRPPHRDGCTLHSDCPSEAETFDEVSALRAEVARLREERRWIPVGERLPEPRLDVLVVEDDGERIVASVNERGVWGHAFGSGNVTNGQCWPTHWMPLPAPPNGGEGE